MNYILELRAFNDYLAKNKLSTGQIALWYALMDVGNRCYWPEWFSVDSHSLEIRTDLSRQGIKNAREKLEELGLIKTKSNRTKAVSYKIISFEESKRNDSIMSTTTQDILQAGKTYVNDYATFLTSGSNIFDKFTQDILQAESGTQPKTRGRTPSKTKTYKTYNIYSKPKKYKDYNQREYDKDTLDQFYSNN